MSIEMKTLSTFLIIIAGSFSIITTSVSCAKPDHSADLPKEQQIVGQWYISRLELNIYSGSVLIKDSIIPQLPNNFVRFDAGGGFAYRFNMPASTSGTYQFSGVDSIISVTPGNTYRWKFLTLTKNLLTVSNTSTNNPSYPGATVVSFHTFGRR